MATPEDKARDAGPPTVIGVGMPQTGTTSLAAALTELGYKHIYDSLNYRTVPQHWAFIEGAAIATWPEVNAKGQSPPPKPFTREDRDELFGVFDVLTDLTGYFALELADAYPEAKIILTERKMGKWLPSYDSRVLQTTFGPGVNWVLWVVGTIIGNRAGFAVQKMISGYYGGAGTLEELRLAAPDAYRQHSERIKAHIAPERLLVYRVGKDGWEPLCDFLGKEVPQGKEFPSLNDNQAHDKSSRKIIRQATIQAAQIVGKYGVALVAVGVAWWWLR